MELRNQAALLNHSESVELDNAAKQAILLKNQHEREKTTKKSTHQRHLWYLLMEQIDQLQVQKLIADESTEFFGTHTAETRERAGLYIAEQRNYINIQR